MTVRHLVVVLSDQLDRSSSAFDGFDPAADIVWMCESRDEFTRVWSSKPRIALFLAAMRHFAADVEAAGVRVTYRRLDDRSNGGGLRDELAAALAESRPSRVVMTEPGGWHARETLREVCRSAGIPLDEREDRHFFCSIPEFARHAAGRKQLRMEHFYREMRRRHGVLLEGAAGAGGSASPAGGRWNFDTENREAFGADGPGEVPPRARFQPDALTRSVLDLVRWEFPGHPGELDEFAWPVTPAQAQEALRRFVDERLPSFGTWQDAMWMGEPWLYHSHLSAALNLKIIPPREVVAAAEQAWRDGRADLSSVEGFVRQVLGWREYVRGVYWLKMPGYLDLNALDAHADLPAWYWTGRTDMACLRDVIGQTLRFGYAHHIQRLMVTGLFALLLGVEPRQVHEWYLGVYVDALEWVELPNTLGMSQFADGGLMASKPYAATGKYISRMSNACRGCPYRPDRRTGPDACPFTTLYWDFLSAHRRRLDGNPRMALQVRNLARVGREEMAAVRSRAAAIRRGDVGAA